MHDLQAAFGGLDIYLFDQLVRGRIRPDMRVLDAGCGRGRNLQYLMRRGVEVFGADLSDEAVQTVRELAARLAPSLPASNFRTEPVEAMTFEAGFADAVVASAVLHFARDDDHFAAMLQGAWRMLAPGGVFFCRLASSIGMAERMRPIGGGRFRLPDGTERYLVDEQGLIDWTRRLGAELLDPLKTTVVQDQRCMTTWLVRRAPSPAATSRDTARS